MLKIKAHCTPNNALTLLAGDATTYSRPIPADPASGWSVCLFGPPGKWERSHLDVKEIREGQP